MIRRIPFPICGLSLAFAALGNLLEFLSPGIHTFCGLISAVLGILWLLRSLFSFKFWLKEMSAPETASISGTFSMTLMLLSGYLVPLSREFALCLWYAGLLLHICMALWFTRHFLCPPRLSQIYASYFIVYVGIAAAAIPTQNFSVFFNPACLCWTAIIVFLPLLILVTARYLREGDPDNAGKKPLFCIYAAPASLCLTGYLSCASDPDRRIVIFLLFFSLGLYCIVLCRLPSFLRLGLTPACAAFTFPMIISAIALKKAVLFLKCPGFAGQFLSIFQLIQTGIACCLVLYAAVCYIRLILHTS